MSTDPNLEQRLVEAAGTRDRSERTLRVAAVIEDALREAGDHPVLVGGAAVEVYTRALYTTVDLDFVAAGGESSAAALRALGFAQRGRAWLRDDLGVIVELPSSSLAPAKSVSMRVGSSKLEIISVEDLIVDRLAAWKYWGWHPDGVAAGLMLDIHGAGLDVARMETRARAEQAADALAVLRALLMEAKPLTEARLAAAHKSLART